MGGGCLVLRGDPLWGPDPCLCGAGRVSVAETALGPLHAVRSVLCALAPQVRCPGPTPACQTCHSPVPSARSLWGAPPGGDGCFLDLFAAPYAQASGRPPSPGLTQMPESTPPAAGKAPLSQAQEEPPATPREQPPAPEEEDKSGHGP